MSTKVEVFASPGWEAEVDTDWAEGLFAVFLRSARSRRRGPKGTTKVIPKGDVSDGVILLTVRKEGGADGLAGQSDIDGAESDDTTPRGARSPDTRRNKRPRKVDERTAKMGAEVLARSRAGTGRKSRPRHGHAPLPPPPERPMTPRTAVPPPPPSGSQTTRRAQTPAPPTRSVPPPVPGPKIERPTVPTSEAGKAMPGEGLGAFFAEMSTLVKYGHVAQVRSEIDRKLVQWPDDLGFRRLIIDFFHERGLVSEAIEALFGLATIHFDRREMPQMRQCLDEVLRLDPTSRRAKRMRELLDRRPGRPRPG